MGAIARQVAQVKRKNSTNCRLPEARLTVLGSVASRSGPRDVATGSGAIASVGVTITSTVGARVGSEGRNAVGLDATSMGAAGCWADDSVGTAAGAQEANSMMSRLKLVLNRRVELVEGAGLKRFFIIKSFLFLSLKGFTIQFLPKY